MLSRLRTIWQHREIVTTLAEYDIRARYKQSLLGAGWALIQPFVTMIVFTFVFSKFARVPTGNVPYPVFSFSALVFWTYFSTSLTKGTLSLVANGSLIRKIYFPREIFAIVALISGAFDLSIAFTMLLGLMLWYQIMPTAQVLWIFPILLLQAVFVCGLIFFTSVLHARFRDVGNAIGLVIQMWMFASPVAYPLSLVPAHLKQLYLLNPMAGIIDSYRRVIVDGSPPDWHAVAIAALATLVTITLSYRFFLRREATLADFI